MTKISIIIPVFNAKSFLLKRALLSCIHQSLKEIEILVVFDGVQDEDLKTICVLFLV